MSVNNESRTAKGVRMVNALSAVKRECEAAGNTNHAEVMAQVIRLPFSSLVTLAEAFEVATADLAPTLDRVTSRPHAAP